MSKHHKKHHVRQHHWINGTLATVEHFFDSLAEAIAHANESEAHTVKVYDEEGQLAHIVTPDGTETYA
jgi:hypothetical protein